MWPYNWPIASATWRK